MPDLHCYISSFWLRGTDPPYYISCFLVRGDRHMPTPLITSHVFWLEGSWHMLEPPHYISCFLVWEEIGICQTPSLHFMFYSLGGG
jgi:hypothetical protein